MDIDELFSSPPAAAGKGGAAGGTARDGGSRAAWAGESKAAESKAAESKAAEAAGKNAQAGGVLSMDELFSPPPAMACAAAAGVGAAAGEALANDDFAACVAGGVGDGGFGLAARRVVEASERALR